MTVNENNLALTASSNLKAFYKFEDTLNDSSGNDKHASSRTGTTASYISGGKYGKAIDPADDVNIPSLDINVNNDWAITFFCKIPSDDSYTEPVVLVEDISSGPIHIFVYGSATYAMLCRINGFEASHVSLPASWDGDGEWHQLVYQRKNNTIEYYMDGVAHSSTDTIPSNKRIRSTSSLQGFLLGYTADSRDYHHSSVDSLRCYNRALTQTEITSLATGVPIDQTAPTLTASVNKMEGNTPLTIRLTQRSNEAGTISSWIDSDSANSVDTTVTANTDYTRDIVFSTAGTYVISVKATDESGNNSAVQTFTIRATDTPIDQTAPTLTASVNKMEGNTPLTIRLTQRSNEAGTISSWIDSDSANSVDTTVTANTDYTRDIVFSTAGTYVISVKATDESGNNSAVQTFTIRATDLEGTDAVEITGKSPNIHFIFEDNLNNHGSDTLTTGSQADARYIPNGVVGKYLAQSLTSNNIVYTGLSQRFHVNNDVNTINFWSMIPPIPNTGVNYGARIRLENINNQSLDIIVTQTNVEVSFNGGTVVAFPHNKNPYEIINVNLGFRTLRGAIAYLCKVNNTSITASSSAVHIVGTSITIAFSRLLFYNHAYRWIDSFRIFKYTLTDSEVKSLYLPRAAHNDDILSTDPKLAYFAKFQGTSVNGHDFGKEIPTYRDFDQIQATTTDAIVNSRVFAEVDNNMLSLGSASITFSRNSGTYLLDNLDLWINPVDDGKATTICFYTKIPSRNNDSVYLDLTSPNLPDTNATMKIWVNFWNVVLTNAGDTNLTAAHNLSEGDTAFVAIVIEPDVISSTNSTKVGYYKIYVNGIFINKQKFERNHSTGAMLHYLGILSSNMRGVTTSTATSTAWLESLRLYERALTESEIREIHYVEPPAMAPTITSTHNNYNKYSKDRSLAFDITYSDPNTPAEDTTISVSSDLAHTSIPDSTGTTTTRSVTFVPTVTGTHTITIRVANTTDPTIFAETSFTMEVVDIVVRPYTFATTTINADTGVLFNKDPDASVENNIPVEPYEYTYAFVNVSGDPTPSLQGTNPNPVFGAGGRFSWTPSVAGVYRIQVKRQSSIDNTLASTPVTLMVIVTTPIQTPSLSNITVNGNAVNSGDDIGNIQDLKRMVVAGTIVDGDRVNHSQTGLGRVASGQRGSFTTSSDTAFEYVYTPANEHPQTNHGNRGLWLILEFKNQNNNAFKVQLRIRFTLVDNTPPALSFTWEQGSSSNPTAGETVRGRFTATDDDPITLTISPTNVAGVTFTDNGDGTGDFVWVIPDDGVSQTFTVTATALGGTDDSMLAITVDPLADAAPVFTSTHNDVAKWSKDHTYNTTVSYSDANTPDVNTTLTVTSNKAATITGSGTDSTDLSRNVSITPTVTGTHTITITLSNTADSTIQSVEMFDIEVVDVVAGPFSFPDSPYTATVDRSITINPSILTFPNEPDESYTYGVSFDSTTPQGTNPNITISSAGIINWTPSVLGSYTIIATRTNDADSSLVTTATLVINVVTNQPPTITPASTNLNTVSAGSTLTLNYTFEDAEGDPIPTATVNAGRGTLTVSTTTIANDTGQLRWDIPSSQPAGSYDVVITCGGRTRTDTIMISNAEPTISPRKTSGRSIPTDVEEIVIFDIVDTESSPITSLEISHPSFTRGEDYRRTRNNTNTQLTLRYTPETAHIGSQTFTVTVVSVGVTVSQDYIFNVLANRPPVITPVSGNPTSGTAGQSITLNYELVDNDGDAIPVPTTNLPTAQTTITPSTSNGGATNDRLRVVWAIPANQPAGSFDIVISAGGGTLTTTVTVINTAPTISPNKASGRSIIAGRGETITFTVSDIESSTISNLRASHSSFTSGTEYTQTVLNNVLTLGYTPTTQHIGSQTFTISVESAGVTTTIEYVIAVIADTLPVVTPDNNVYPLRIAQNTQVTDTFRATDANDVITDVHVRSDTIPRESFGGNALSGIITLDWTPTSETVTGAHTLAITVVTAHSTTTFPFVIIVQRSAGQYSSEIIVDELHTINLVNDVDTTDPLTDYEIEITNGPNTTDTLAITREGTIHKLRFRPTVVSTYRITVSVIAGVDTGHSIVYDFTVTPRAKVLQTIGVYLNGIRTRCVSCKIDDSYEKNIPVAEVVLPAEVNVQHNDDVKIILDPNFKEENLNSDVIGAVVKKLPFSDYGNATQNPNGTIAITFDTQLIPEIETVETGLELLLDFENSIQPNASSSYAIYNQYTNPQYVVGKFGKGFVGDRDHRNQNYINYKTTDPSDIVTLCYWVKGRYNIRLYSNLGRRFFTLANSSTQDKMYLYHSASTTTIDNYDRDVEHFIVCEVENLTSNLRVKLYIDNNATPKIITLPPEIGGIEELVITKYSSVGYLDSVRMYHRILNATERSELYNYDPNRAQRIANEGRYLDIYNGYGLVKQSFTDNLALDLIFNSMGASIKTERDIQIVDLTNLATYAYNVDTRSYQSIGETHMIFYEFDFSNDFILGMLVDEPTTRKSNLQNDTISTVIHCRKKSDRSTLFKIDIIDTAGVISIKVTVASIGNIPHTFFHIQNVEKIIISRNRSAFNVRLIDNGGVEYSEGFAVNVGQDYSGILTINADYYNITRVSVYEAIKSYTILSNELKPIIQSSDDDIIRRDNDPKIIVDDGLKCFLPLNGDLRDHTESGNDGITVDHSGVIFDRSEDRFGTAFRGDTTS